MLHPNDFALELGAGLLQTRLQVTRVKPCKHLPRSDALAVTHVHVKHSASDWGGGPHPVGRLDAPV
jgi:hypothetical protein